jgi:hypothetical protein
MTAEGLAMSGQLRDLVLPGISFALVLLLAIIYIRVGNPTVNARIPSLARGVLVLLLNLGLLAISAVLACNFVAQHEMLVEEGLAAASWLLSSTVVIYSRFIRKQAMVPVYVRLWWTLAMGFTLMQLHNHSRHGTAVADAQVVRAVLSVLLALHGMCESPPRTFDVYNPLKYKKETQSGEEAGARPPLVRQSSEAEAMGSSTSVPGEARKKNQSGEAVASLLSSLTFHWMSPLLLAGGKEPLVYDQLFDLEEKDQAQVNSEMLSQAWLRRVEHSRKCRAEGKKADPSLTWAIHEHQMYEFWLNGLLELMQDGIVYVMPKLIHGMIEYAQSDDQSTVGSGGRLHHPPTPTHHTRPDTLLPLPHTPHPTPRPRYPAPRNHR